MDRREVLKISSLLLGYTLTGSAAVALLNGCKAETSADWQPKSFSEDEVSLLAEICEAILPRTDTPGAKDALCHRYIDELVANFYTLDKRKYFKESLAIFNEKSKDKYAKAFVALNPTEKEEILSKLADEAKEYKDDSGEKPHIFLAIKQSTISGYFTSEVGAKGGLCEFIPVPGPYQGCIDYTTVGKGYVLN
ncbi:MAG: gluconate 2-dehydrogenase subunit 3 family protein [Saprospiraceae bacterium]|nr:gluconate 2-dehydrogenase subunit 3 family protein [Saprospiraceae bacterium]